MKSEPMSFDLGFVGGGQLARMSIMAAQRMGLRCLSLDPGRDTPASQIAASIEGDLGDVERLAVLMRRCRRITLENEFVPAEALESALLESGREPDCLIPGFDCLAVVQDKLRQREAYARAGVPSPCAVPADRANELPLPRVYKARFGGYDGKGTRTARTHSEVDEINQKVDLSLWLAEEFVPFHRELAVMVYRTPVITGCFPTMETIQVNHVCDLVFPAETDASGIAIAAVEAVNGFGLFGVELFESADGSLSVNEIAPRPHNTGHYTLDWGGISQFEQHVRVATHLSPMVPAGSPTAMANLLGQHGAVDWRKGLRNALSVEPRAHVHWYGKSESRPGRKMGHINAVGNNAREMVERARSAFYEAWVSPDSD
ncbi:MAG: ATP-grasp domain-containing protein [Fimbriimonadaceae bacterium]|nr:ATP-grasp domain-containing protein [Fimbriimonadaceae bacterium]